MEAEYIESFYSEILQGTKVDRSEGFELKQILLENADCIPPDLGQSYSISYCSN